MGDTQGTNGTDMSAILARLDALDTKLDALSGLQRTLDRLGPDGLARLESAIHALGTFAERLPVVADAAGTSVRFAMQQAEARGIDPIASGVDAGELMLEAARAENLALARRLLAQREALTDAVSALESIDKADLRTLTLQGAALSRTLAAALRTPELSALLEVGASSPVLSTAQAATTALVSTRKEPVEEVGLFGALSKMGDPDVKRAVGFTLGLAKRFGALLGR